MLPDFLSRSRDWKIAALAVDEAHCISEWGHDFRAEYRRLKEVRQAIPDIPVLALTATATQRVREDIVKQLELRDPAVFLASFNRPNLKYQVIAKSGAAAQVCNVANARPEDSGIVSYHLKNSQLVLRMMETGLVRLAFEIDQHRSELAGLAKRYADRQPDFADLCLIRMSELNPQLPVITVDGNFRIYCRKRRETIPVIFPPDC